jgi:signal transduction histidine kinase
MQRREAYSERAVKAIVDQTEQLDRLIGDLLLASSLEAGALTLRPERLDLVEKAKACVEEARAASGRHAVRVEAPDGPVVGTWDPDRLSQVLRNLLGNALKYSPDGGEIVVRVEDRGTEAEVAVRDQGLGIESEALSKLFGRFYRAESVAQAIHGIGLGLYVTKELVEAHGGRIWAESGGAGQGSTFRFTLPLSAAEPRIMETSAPADATP